MQQEALYVFRESFGTSLRLVLLFLAVLREKPRESSKEKKTERRRGGMWITREKKG